LVAYFAVVWQLGFAFVYNAAGVPLAAGVFFR